MLKVYIFLTHISMSGGTVSLEPLEKVNVKLEEISQGELVKFKKTASILILEALNETLPPIKPHLRGLLDDFSQKIATSELFDPVELIAIRLQNDIDARAMVPTDLEPLQFFCNLIQMLMYKKLKTPPAQLPFVPQGIPKLYQLVPNIKVLCRNLGVVALFSEDLEVVGFGGINPLALEIVSNYSINVIRKLKGNTVYTHTTIMQHNDWDMVFKRHFPNK